MGSEMCIRDRSGPWVGPKMIAGHAILEITLLFALFYGLAPLFKNCLLYTSDAADERSSVDLGGRRIIKKKINSHT